MPPDWKRIFPDADHRWIMGLRQELSPGDFFCDADPAGTVRDERRHWLTVEPGKYAVMLPAAEPALAETVALARSQGAPIDPSETSFHQLLQLGQWWEPDFVWMHPDEAGDYLAIGGVVCFPSSWALTEKIGRPIGEIHLPVPELNAQLGRSIATFLSKQLPNVSWRRENWSLSRAADLNQHPTRPRPRLDETVTAEEVWIRLEHQLLMKLPSSGTVFFGIRIEVVPLAAVIANPSVAHRFARILSTISEAAARYKNIDTARHRLIALLQSQ